MAATLALQQTRGEAEGFERNLADLTKRLEGERAALLEAEQRDDVMRQRAPGAVGCVSHRSFGSGPSGWNWTAWRRWRAISGGRGERWRIWATNQMRPSGMRSGISRPMSRRPEHGVGARAREASAAREELSACRQRYLEVVSGALQVPGGGRWISPVPSHRWPSRWICPRSRTTIARWTRRSS